MSPTLSLDPSHHRELMLNLFHQVQFDTFEAYDDPRCNVAAITLETFARTLPRLPADIGLEEAYERLMDVSMQLAADAMREHAGRPGPGQVHLIPLTSLYGFRFGEVDDGFRPWLVAVDDLPQRERAVYRLVAVLGWTNARAAGVLGRSQGWTSRLMKRARKRLTAAGVCVEELEKGFFDVETERRKEKACPR
ncbi:sigma factor-like helix-turn-helix DNA-binding protein [Streptomyces sp. NPDC002588]|uniref:RNA polymerase sigma factor n=1 Tax=Streptomyces sp. NPDC002588 TaxID=3154419 RepID=UPI0033172F34